MSKQVKANTQQNEQANDDETQTEVRTCTVKSMYIVAQICFCFMQYQCECSMLSCVFWSFSLHVSCLCTKVMIKL